MAREYHCLIAGLPEITIDQNKLSFSFKEFKEELKETLHADDYMQVKLLFLQYDNENLLNTLQKNEAEFNELGNYSIEYLEEQIQDPEQIESYLAEFINAYKEDQSIIPELPWENQLAALYYKYIIDNSPSFLSTWFTFERNLKNVSAAINCRLFEKPIEKEIIGDDAIAESIRTNSTRDFGLSHELDFIEKLVQLFESKRPLDREKELDALIWNFLEEATTFEYFSIEKVIAYTIQFRIVERWLHLDPETGRELFKKLINKLETSYEFPKEFALAK